MKPRIHDRCRNCDGDGIYRVLCREDPARPDEVTSMGLGVCRNYDPAPAEPEKPKPIPRKRETHATREAAGQKRLLP